MNPCDILGRIGFDALGRPDQEPFLSGEEIVEPAQPNLRLEEHRRIADLLRSEPPKVIGDSVYWLGRRITWPFRVPRFITWSGNQDLAKLIRFRQEAMGTGSIDDLFAFRAPMTGASGFDPAVARDNLDVGFSTSALGIPIMQRPALELLAVIGLETVPLISFGTREVGFIHDGQIWRLTVEARTGGYYHRWGWINRKPTPV